MTVLVAGSRLGTRDLAPPDGLAGLVIIVPPNYSPSKMRAGSNWQQLAVIPRAKPAALGNEPPHLGQKRGAEGHVGTSRPGTSKDTVDEGRSGVCAD
jgi:hypothetical protein